MGETRFPQGDKKRPAGAAQGVHLPVSYFRLRPIKESLAAAGQACGNI